jgi:hypothetical protein
MLAAIAGAGVGSAPAARLGRGSSDFSVNLSPAKPLTTRGRLGLQSKGDLAAGHGSVIGFDAFSAAKQFQLRRKAL